MYMATDTHKDKLMNATEVSTLDKVASAAMVGGSGWSLLDLPYSEIAAILTCLVGIAQLIIAAPKVYKVIKGWLEQLRGKDDGSNTGATS